MPDLATRLREEWTPPFLATAVLMILAITLGGASRVHELRLALVELAALPVIVLSVFALGRSARWPASRLFLGLVAGLVALPLLQLVPLPPQLWTRLPGREEMVLALEVSGLTPGWSPMSLTPDKTWRSVLALLPSIAMVLGVLATTARARRHLVGLFLILVTAAILLGAVQLASGDERFYPWATTNAGAMVGFFANRNHMATACLVALPLAAALFAQSLRKSGQNPLMVGLSLALIALIIVAIGFIRSRMGLALLAPTLLASLVAAWIANGRGRPSALFLALAGVAGVALVVLVSFTLAPTLARFGADDSARTDSWVYVMQAADRFAPIGSGIGSFDAVFRSVEPLTKLDNTYFNQAHNDYLESWLETGVFGAALLAVFLVWFARRAWTAWRGSGTTDRDIQRCASIGIAAVLAHSLVDYPLRTAAMATVFALLCVLMEITPVARSSRR